MRTPPRAPFLSLRSGRSEDGAFHDDAAEAVRRLARSLGGLARLARALLEAGERIDLAGLSAQVGLLCAKTLDLEPDRGRQLRTELIALRGDLDLLSQMLGRPPPDR